MIVKDSGKRESFDTGAVRDTQEGKGRYDLLPFHAIGRVAKLFEAGANKYAAENWRRGIPLRRFLDSALRHLAKAAEGQRDEDHFTAAAWNILCLIETAEMVRRDILPTTLLDLPDWTEGRTGGAVDDQGDKPVDSDDSRAVAAYEQRAHQLGYDPNLPVPEVDLPCSYSVLAEDLVDLDACGTSDGVTPLAETYGVHGFESDWRAEQEGDIVAPGGQYIAGVVEGVPHYAPLPEPLPRYYRRTEHSMTPGRSRIGYWKVVPDGITFIYYDDRPARPAEYKLKYILEEIGTGGMEECGQDGQPLPEGGQ